MDEEYGQRSNRHAGAGGGMVILAIAACVVAFKLGIIKVPEPVDPPAQGAPAPPAVQEIYNLGNIDCGNGVPVVEGSAPIERVKNTLWSFLRSANLTPNQAAGVMGNIQAESGFNTTVEEREPNAHGTRGIGLAQWTGNRRDAIESDARRCRKPVGDLSFQVYYLYHDLHQRPADRPEYRRFGNEWGAVANQGTVEDALVAFHHEFEISHLMDLRNPRQAVISARAGLAYAILDQYT